MSLITCRECKAQVSSEARRCQQCGVTSPVGEPLTWLWFAITVVVVLTVAFALA